VKVALDVGKSKVAITAAGPSLASAVEERLEVTSPVETVEAAIAWVARLADRHGLDGVGLSMFGPLETTAGAADFGSILGGSDDRWSGLNVPRLIARALGADVFFDVDVLAGALAEARHDGCRSPDSFVYLSMGTGVGGAFFDGGDARPARPAPQIGHMYVTREPDDGFAGSCRFHGDCLQGLASGVAIAERWGRPAHEIPHDHPAWDLEARYVARACCNLYYSFFPARILVGSGLAMAPDLVTRADAYLHRMASGFPAAPEACRTGGRQIVRRAALAPRSSLFGAMLLVTDRTGHRMPA
jgi:fructokinase